MTLYECPYCHADNQDMFVGMGENKMLCTACDKEFDEGDVIEKNSTGSYELFQQIHSLFAQFTAVIQQLEEVVKDHERRLNELENRGS